MTVSELVGAVATAILREELTPDSNGPQGTSRFALNLNAEQTAAVAHAVLADPFLHNNVDLKLPESYVGNYGLPEEALTTRPATYFRNATCAKAAFLLADVEHDEEASLNEIARLGPAELLDRIDLWVRAVSGDLHIPDEHIRWWARALTGLRDLRLVSLDRFATYVLRTRDSINADGQPLLFALGAALPALRLPRDTWFFNGIKDKARGFPSAWRAHFATAQRRRAGLLLKQTSSQILLNEEDLNGAFEKVRGVIPEVLHSAIESFIAAPSGWNAKAADLAECEWEEIKPLFDGLQREKFNLGQATISFYEECEPGLLSEDDRDYLKLLVGRRTTESNEDDVSFYESHRNELKEDRKLKSAWDRFVFGRPIEATDFLAGLASALEPLLNRAPLGSNRKLSIRCDRATKRDLRELNVEAGLYFAHRYAGLARLFGGAVSWDVGDLFKFAELAEGWRAAGKATLNRSVSKTALQLKFVLELETETDTGDVQTCSAQLVWRYQSNAVTCQLAEDWKRLAQHPLILCRAARELSGAKTRATTVDLGDVKTFVPAYDRDRGSFVPVYKPERDIAKLWRERVARGCNDRFLTKPAADALTARFDQFEVAYTTAIRGFAEHGASHAANLDQAIAYAALLDTVVAHAKGDRNRELLLKPLLQIGVVPVEGGAPAAVVTPWNPFRLVSMWRKARLAADLIAQLVGDREVLFGDTRLFFKDLAQDLAHPLYPELAVAWGADGAQLLSISDVVQDYSLHEPPVAPAEGGDNTGESPAEGSACVLDLVRRYLALHPHERANMSVVLFNCDSARLPQAVVDKLGLFHDDDEDVRCQVLLRHVEDDRLRDVYRSILGADTSADAYSASEATQDFMARLRISVIADQAPPPDPKDGCPYDIVFSQDVISRHARVEWYAEMADPADIRTLMPSRWSRRRTAAADDLKSAVYLCCPVQSPEGWSYLTALATMFRGDWDGDTHRRLLPVRQLDFRDGRTARIFQETHDLGNWVVNFDELLDRRQLLNQDVRIIRYKQSATQGRNVVISSRAPLGLLRSMILNRLRGLGLDLSEIELRSLADRLIDDANDVSGDIVLRAAKRGESASELIGVVLSRRLIRDELGEDQLFGWYFLDDYAAWMGQREEQLADLLAICPHDTPEGMLRVTMVVSEAKYVELDSLAAKKKESQKQLRDTVRRIDEAVFGDPERLDRDSWLSRLADLMLDGIRVPAASGIDLGVWRRALREGRCEIEIRGASHVFVPTATDGVDCSDVSEISGIGNAFQEIFGRPLLKRLLQAYWRGENTRDIRVSNGAEHLAAEPNWRRPGSGLTSTAAHRLITAPQASIRPPKPAMEASDAASLARADEPIAAPPIESALPLIDGWAYPGISRLLSATPDMPEGAEDREWLARTAAATKSALQQLQLQAKLTTSSLTPNSALLRFAGSANLTVDQVLRKRSELLTTFGLNIISVRPEPGAVVIAVERPARQTIQVATLWADWAPETGGWGNQDLLIAVRENDGSHLFLSPGRAHAPHTLIAGSTGSGKSVLVQNIILGIAATNTPEQARIILIDPKQGVDYFAFEGLPHLDGGIIDSQERATERLTELVAEMDRRYVLFKQTRVPNLGAFNAKVPPQERLPVLWLIHDEFAEWMLTDEYKEAVSSIVQRLGVKARAAGIYLVFAAQRPDANVMPMQLRANLGNRLILRVDGEGTSEIALGERGAERLLGRGHLLAKLEGERDLCFGQVPFVDPEFADALVAATQRPHPPSR
jgi:S-DNA-T family DNA segregation ATPase FtsK/SpoIIIE